MLEFSIGTMLESYVGTMLESSTESVLHFDIHPTPIHCRKPMSFRHWNVGCRHWNGIVPILEPRLGYRSELWDHLFFDDCLNYLNFNSVTDEICTLNNVKAINIIFISSLEWSCFVKFLRSYCTKSQNFNVFLSFK